MAKRERIDRIGGDGLVSIITINYNQAEITRQFPEPTRFLTYPNYEIIVVDNGSVQPLYDVFYPVMTLNGQISHCLMHKI